MIDLISKVICNVEGCISTITIQIRLNGYPDKYQTARKFLRSSTDWEVRILDSGEHLEICPECLVKEKNGLELKFKK